MAERSGTERESSELTRVAHEMHEAAHRGQPRQRLPLLSECLRSGGLRYLLAYKAPGVMSSSQEVQKTVDLPEGYSMRMSEDDRKLLLLVRPDGSVVEAFEFSAFGPSQERVTRIAFEDAAGGWDGRIARHEP